MNTPSGHTVPWWAKTRLDFSAGMLRDDTTADVCIIGGGIAGLTTAYLLGRENLHVVVIDADAPTSGETSRTTAHLASAIDDRFYNIERWHGEHGAKVAAASHSSAIDLIERIVSEEMIECDFRRVDGHLFAPDDDLQELQDELEAAHRAGLRGVELIDTPSFAPLGGPKCLRFPRQGQFNPLQYLKGLVGLIESQEGRIFGQTRAIEVSEGKEIVVTTDTGRRIRAGSLVVASNTPFNNRVALHSKMAPYRTYVIAGQVPSGGVPAGLYWDNLDPYHYVRLASGDGELDTLIVGGEDHKTGQEEHTPHHFAELEAWARRRFPQLTQITHRWSGQVMETVDGLGYIGRNPGSTENCYVITGDSGMGMTHGTLGAILVTDLIQKRPNPWAKVYDPDRITLTAAGTYARENLNVARQYLDYARPLGSSDLSDLPANSGRVIQHGLHKLAIYRGPDGTLHEMSAVCPHLGCIVHWNDTERTWDCPCHGSRFEATGDVISGPASKPLTPQSTLSRS
jgi:glycine/D-amino acid oxidase-like deaminating enzyme/nitrite reductase/ring-hydroxylating ferredoxin subunit